MNQTNTGNITTQIEGERIAKAVAEKHSAREVLLNEKRFEFSWTYFGLILMGGLWGWSVSTYIQGSLVTNVIGTAAGVAFMLAVATFNECLRLRRRQVAIIALLKNQNLI